MSATLDGIIAAVTPLINDAQVAVLTVMGAMLVMSASIYGLLRVLRQFYMEGANGPGDEVENLLDSEYDDAVFDPDMTEGEPARNREEWLEIASFLDRDTPVDAPDLSDPEVLQGLRDQYDDFLADNSAVDRSVVEAANEAHAAIYDMTEDEYEEYLRRGEFGA